MKVCKRCEANKPLSEYLPHGKYRDGLRPLCNDCRKADMRDRYHRDPERARIKNAVNEFLRWRNDPRFWEFVKAAEPLAAPEPVQ